MADPEQIYSEVLQEEQGKGVTPAVAEARAKAARARAEHGSPHPKEPKWWPGAQPHLEGDGAAPAEAAEEEAAAEPEAAPEPEPAAAEPAAAAAPPPAAASDRVEESAAPAEAPSGDAASSAPAAAPAPAVAATATSVAPEARPAGVTHGVPTGTRLRPEDEVQTDAQFEAQQMVHERRRRIDEVVAAGGAAPAATGPRSGQWALFLVYLAIVAAAIFVVTENPPAAEGAGGEETHSTENTAGEGSGVSVVAENVAFNTSTLELPADEETPVEFQNNDAASVPHNIAIYKDDSASKTLFQGEVIPGGESVTYDVPALKAGSYYFQCDVHPGMNGDVEVK